MAANKKSRRIPRVKVGWKAVVAIVVCIALSAGTYLMFTKPQRADAAALNEQVRVADAILASNTQRIDDIENGKTVDTTAQLARAQMLDQQLPATLDRVSLAATIPNLAMAQGITVNQMDPVDGEAGTGNLKAFTFNMAVAGSVEAITGFLTALRSSNPLTTISDAALTITGGTATATFTLTAFSVTTPPLGAPPVPAS